MSGHTFNVTHTSAPPPHRQAGPRRRAAFRRSRPVSTRVQSSEIGAWTAEAGGARGSAPFSYAASSIRLDFWISGSTAAFPVMPTASRLTHGELHQVQAGGGTPVSHRDTSIAIASPRRIRSRGLPRPCISFGSGYRPPEHRATCAARSILPSEGLTPGTGGWRRFRHLPSRASSNASF